MAKEQIVYKQLDEIHLNEKNPRKNDQAVEEVAKSIKEFGFKNPLIIDKDGKIWCGNTRYKAAKKLKLDEVPCIVVDDLTEEQIRKYALLDNKTNEIAEWDYELLADELETLDMSGYDIDWGVNQIEPVFNDEQEEFNETEDLDIDKHLLQCPVCGHINEEKAFKYHEDSN